MALQSPELLSGNIYPKVENFWLCSNQAIVRERCLSSHCARQTESTSGGPGASCDVDTLSSLYGLRDSDGSLGKSQVRPPMETQYFSMRYYMSGYHHQRSRKEPPKTRLSERFIAWYPDTSAVSSQLTLVMKAKDGPGNSHKAIGI